MSNFENTPKTFSEMWAYARTGPSIYVPDIDGLLIEYPANTAPLNQNGILLEHSATNLLLHSRDMSDDQPLWDGSVMDADDRLRNQTGADGELNSATWIRDDNTGEAGYVQQSITFSPTHYGETGVTYPHTFSVYVQKTEGATVCPCVYLGIPAESLAGGWAINTNTGVATRISSLGSDGSIVVESVGDWWRVAVTVGYLEQPDEVTAVVRLYPAASSTSTPGTISVAATGSAVFDFGQFEANSSIATSAIPTSGTTQTRHAATLTHSSLDDYALPEITALVEYSDAVYEPWDIFNLSLLSSLLDINNGSTSIIQLGVRSSSDDQGNCYAFARNSGSTSDVSRFFDFAASGKIAASYSQERNESNTAANGVGKTIAGDSTTHTPINIVLKARIMAYIQRAEIYMHAKSASELATLTAP